MTALAIQLDAPAPTILQFPPVDKGYTASVPTGETVRFEHNGRKYKIFKRTDRPRGTSRAFYFEIHVNRRRFKRCLDSSDPTEAIERAKVFIDSFVRDKWTVKRLRVRRGEFSLETIFEIYDKVAVDIARRSRQNNKLALLKIVEVVAGARQEAKDIMLHQINPALARRYQDIVAANYCKAAATDDASQRIARERAHRSTKSTINQARSLFSRRAENDMIAQYGQAGIKIPASIVEFMSAKLLGSRFKSDYNPSPDSVVKASFEEIEKLRESEPDVFKAFWLAVGAGLRRGEIQQARWSHLIERAGAVWFHGGIGKDGEVIDVKMQTRAAEALRPFRPERGIAGVVQECSADWIIEERSRWHRKLSAWMRERGWKTQKTLHELRAYVGSKIFEKDHRAAQAFMRHKSIKVTERFYARYAKAAEQPDVL